jgi:hypothetical protein
MLTSIGRCGTAEGPALAHGADVVSPRDIGGSIVPDEPLGGPAVAQGARVGSMGCENSL